MAYTKKKRNNEMINLDLNMALELQQMYNPIGITENAVFPKDKESENYRPRTLVDQTLEIVDPTPNIYTLFAQFNVRFFSNKLLSAEVKWSQRMTSCAGVCTFHPRSRDCIISLSAPLLKLRPRKDLVETLLHEMIHGYLFLTNNNRDRDGHGPEFCKMMDRINEEAGTNITIYHSFHEEVKLYKQHWWRCNGPCHKRPPYFGTVRRAMNRAPGPSDFWWQGHQQNCGGTFVKVREPEKKEKSSRSKKRDNGNENIKPKQILGNVKKDKNLDDYIAKFKDIWDEWNGEAESNPVSPIRGGFDSINSVNPGSSNGNRRTGKPSSTGLVKLGTSTNNVHGWGTGGPSSSKTPSFSDKRRNDDNSRSRTLNLVGTVGGAGTGKSNLLDKYPSPKIGNIPPKNRSPWLIEDSPPPAKKPKFVEPPKTEKSIPEDRKNGDFHNCPICNLPIAANLINDHLDVCLVNSDEARSDTRKSNVIEIFDSPVKRRGKPGKSSTPLRGQTNLDNFVISPKKNLVSCPVCDKQLVTDTLYDHLDMCSPKSRETKGTFTGEKVAGTSSRVETKNFVDLSDDRADSSKPYVCLVCNTKMSGDVALADHLETCVQEIFNDDTFDVGNDSLEMLPPRKNESPNDKFPCPICMDLVRENLMNEHLDKCLEARKQD